MVTADVTADDATEYRRRVARSLKNESQFSIPSPGPAPADDDEEEEEVELVRNVIWGTDGATTGVAFGREHIWRTTGALNGVFVSVIRLNEVLARRVGCF